MDFPRTAKHCGAAAVVVVALFHYALATPPGAPIHVVAKSVISSICHIISLFSCRSFDDPFGTLGQTLAGKRQDRALSRRVLNRSKNSLLRGARLSAHDSRLLELAILK
jgi:hypothetical protein